MMASTSDESGKGTKPIGEIRPPAGPADKTPVQEIVESAELDDSRETLTSRAIAKLINEQTAGSQFSRRSLAAIAAFLYIAIAGLFYLPFWVASCRPRLWDDLGGGAQTAMLIAPYAAFTIISAFVLIAFSSLRIRPSSLSPLNAGANAANAAGGVGAS
jgi:hypothetical protein